MHNSLLSSLVLSMVGVCVIGLCAQQKPPSSPPIPVPTGRGFEATTMQAVVEEQQKRIEALNQQIKDLQAQLATAKKAFVIPTTAPVKPPELTTAFFATQFRTLRDVAQQPCRDVGGRLRVTVDQRTGSALVVCEF